MGKKMTMAAAIAVMAMDAAVDRLGAVKAMKAEIEKEEKLLAEKIKVTGARQEGLLFEANPVESERENVDWKSIAEKVGYSPQLKSAHTNYTTVVSLRVTAKTGQMAKAA